MQAFDPRDGRPLWQHRLSSALLLRAPHFIDVDGDGFDEAIFVGAEAIRLWRPEQDEIVWTAPLDGNWMTNMGHREVPEIDDQGAIRVYGDTDHKNVPGARLRALPADLDGDGRLEIVLPGPRVISGVDGRELWKQYLEPDPTLRRNRGTLEHDERFLVGPDIDGDEVKEVFSVTLTRREYISGGEVIVTAFSGASGEALWSTAHSVSGVLDPHFDETPLGAPVWGPPAADSFPQLLAPVRIRYKSSSDYTVTAFAFSASDGQLTNALAEINDPIIADLTGDGLAEVTWFTPERRANWRLPEGRLHALRVRPPALWRRAEVLQMAGDLNGDGAGDLTKIWHREMANASYPGPAAAVSGADGRLMWTTPFDVSSIYQPTTIVDTNETPSVTRILLVRRHRGDKVDYVALTAGSGKVAWVLDDLGKSIDMTTVNLETVVRHDLDRDGRDELIVSYLHTNASRIGVAAVSADTGSFRWNRDWQRPKGSPSPSIAAAAPLSGDRVDDLLVVMKSAEGIRRYATVDGASGDVLWERELPERGIRGFSGEAAFHSTLDTDGDGRHEVLLIDDEVMALDGATGEPKWTWVWPNRDGSRIGDGRAGEEFVPLYDVSAAPSLADVDGDEKQELCLIADDHLIVLDRDGKMIERTPLAGHRPSWDPHDGHVWRIDVDRDGRDELVYLRAIPPPRYSRSSDSPVSIYAAADVGTRVLWKWPLAQQHGQIMYVLPATESADAMIVVQTGAEVHGLSAATGRPLWRCENEPWWTNPGQTQPDHWINRLRGPALLRNANTGEMPLIIFRQIEPGGMTTGVVCRLALPTDATGRYQ